MKHNNTDILTEVSKYYTSKLEMYGETAQGVDWNGEASQTLRFEQLCKIVSTTNQFSINDLGCGYGALYDFLGHEFENFSYSGVDVSDSMINAAQQRYKDKNQARFFASSEPDHVADYGVASGIFNVRLDRSDRECAALLPPA